MIKNYFLKENGAPQSDEVKREKAVAAVLEVIHAAAPQSGAQSSLGHITNSLNAAADAIQAALEKKS